jgi:hypothetical protein
MMSANGAGTYVIIVLKIPFFGAALGCNATGIALTADVFPTGLSPTAIGDPSNGNSGGTTATALAKVSD